MTDTTTALLRQTEAREAERETAQTITRERVRQEWLTNPEDRAREALMDAGLKDKRLLELITYLAMTDPELENTLQWFQVDQRMGEDDG